MSGTVKATTAAPRVRTYRWAAIASLAYTIPVILWGAFVRITGSGAGCGQHWPTCRGEIVPLDPSLETIVEFTHRVTSGICLPSVVVVYVLAYRAFPARHAARWYALLSVVFMVIEALVGAGLVLLEYVGGDTSAARPAWMAGHLLNTYLLTGVMGLAIWTAREDAASFRVLAALRAASPPVRRWALAGAALLCLVSMTGAVTALGDTLFPIEGSSSLAGRLTGEGLGDHFLVRTRAVHPILACAAALYLIAAPWDAVRRRAATALVVAVAVQVVAGFVNIALSAPGWMQLLHLLLALTVWLVFAGGVTDRLLRPGDQP